MAATRTQLFSAATTGTSVPAECAGMIVLKAFLKGTGTISGGTLVFEEADYFGGTVGADGTLTPNPVYTGTWSAIGSTINCTDVDGNKQKAIAFNVQAYSAVRARFTADITGGGSISLELIANGPWL